MNCYCRGQAICLNCEHHSCTDCQCDDIDQTKEPS
jgi:hypothetical protein